MQRTRIGKQCSMCLSMWAIAVVIIIIVIIIVVVIISIITIIMVMVVHDFVLDDDGTSLLSG